MTNTKIAISFHKAYSLSHNLDDHIEDFFALQKF